MRILGTQQFINEKLDIKPLSKKGLMSYKTSYHPKNIDELKSIVKQRIEEEGNSCNLNDIDVSRITSMSGLFCASDFIGDISRWNVRNVISMRGMFSGSKFNGDISRWCVDNVTDMSNMFCGSEFTGDISKWNVSKVVDMGNMFYKSKFNGDISKWDVSKVSSMYCMFNESEFNNDISEWDVKNVKSMRWMFYNAKAFNQNLSLWNVNISCDNIDMFKGSPIEFEIQKQPKSS